VVPRLLVLWSIHTLSVVYCVGGILSAQAPTTPTFDVASVKPVKPEIRIQKPLSCAFGANGRFMGYGWLRYLIACAYGVRSADPRRQILGGPSWLDVDIFELIANAPTENISPSQDESLAMLRTLLAERFHLVVHRETRDVPMYSLVISRRDGRPGPQLRPAAEGCAAWLAGGRKGKRPSVPGDLACGRQVIGPFAFRSAAMPLSQLANLLSARVERPVQDHTGLKGTFALDVQWRPEQGAPNTGPPEDLPTSIFTALQEQLGLKLESTRGPADLLIIDHVEHPTPD
jgi:uncharacterized protein (TIGR03435 family)